MPDQTHDRRQQPRELLRLQRDRQRGTRRKATAGVLRKLGAAAAQPRAQPAAGYSGLEERPPAACAAPWTAAGAAAGSPRVRRRGQGHRPAEVEAAATLRAFRLAPWWKKKPRASLRRLSRCVVATDSPAHSMGASSASRRRCGPDQAALVPSGYFGGRLRREIGQGQGQRLALLPARLRPKQSTHVVEVLDHGIAADGAAPFIVMELLEGTTLRFHCPRSRPCSSWPRTETRDLQDLQALAPGHERGIVRTMLDRRRHLPDERGRRGTLHQGARLRDCTKAGGALHGMSSPTKAGR